jgi:hypothetical protein
VAFDAIDSRDAREVVVDADVTELPTVVAFGVSAGLLAVSAHPVVASANATAAMQPIIVIAIFMVESSMNEGQTSCPRASFLGIETTHAKREGRKRKNSAISNASFGDSDAGVATHRRAIEKDPLSSPRSSTFL